ncbi:MAG: PD-(D/E)XK nuclease family protein [Bacteroides sp.]|nr:PD-(D/E)XK nuclease family protein [Bacteroides sp.]
MNTFLQLVAEDIYKKTGGDLSGTAIVFPNKRARLFFNEHLASQHNGPMWSPAYISISELFQQLSPYQLGDPIQLVCEVYKVFCQVTGKAETLDDFYFWGELLISDFDDVDKNLVDAGKLFTNLKELKEMDDFSFLTKEQVETIQQFFENFSIEKETELKKRFLTLWDKLGAIYTNFRQRLKELGIAYEGMMYREVIEQLEAEKLEYEHYVFVGFNVLNEVEKRFFRKLQAAGKAMFYWDYDTYYTQAPQQAALPYMHEAGEFIIRNMAKFPNELPATLFDRLREKKSIRYISSPTENGQARYLPQWIKNTIKDDDKNLKENAVVLCNEALLLPILHSIPEQVKHANITMGFPFTQTPTYSFITSLLELQLNGYRKGNRFEYRYVLNVLRHPFTQQLSPNATALEGELTKKNRFFPTVEELQADDFLKLLFTPKAENIELCQYLIELLYEASKIYRTTPQEDEDEEVEHSEEVFDQLYQESLYKGYKLITRIQSLLESGELESINKETLQRLLNRLMMAETIPFHGEPAIGLQIMGVLETRNLDFKNLIMLSLNEGKLPKKERESSFIPYNLRKGFGMTTIEHKNAVYAYYFYRLIQRAENITLVYNTSSEGLNRGEMSRFMLQLLAEYPHSIENYYLEAGQQAEQEQTIVVEKSKEIIEILQKRFDATDEHNKHVLSPSALNTYLNCPLSFYFRHVAGLKVSEEVSAEIDSKLFGTIFHRSAELIYDELTSRNKEVSKADLQALLKDDARILGFVDTAFKEILFQIKKQEKAEYNGQQLINSQVISYYLKQLLKNDLKYAPFTLEGMETRVSEVMHINSGVGEIAIRLGGTIDRMDKKEGTLRILDYKTGGKPKKVKEMDELFTPDKDRAGYIFQTFLYAAIMSKKQDDKVAPALLYIHHAAEENYSPLIEFGSDKEEVNDFSLYENDFRKKLQKLLEEIFGLETPFKQTTIEENCKYCDFKRLCKRSNV